MQEVLLAPELGGKVLCLHEAQSAFLRLGGWFRVHSNFSSIFKKFDREGATLILKKILYQATTEKVLILDRVELLILDLANIIYNIGIIQYFIFGGV